jgi:hypothetical protein
VEEKEVTSKSVDLSEKNKKKNILGAKIFKKLFTT